MTAASTGEPAAVTFWDQLDLEWETEAITIDADWADESVRLEDDREDTGR